MLPWLILLVSLPIGAYIWAKKNKPEKKFSITLLVFGLIIAPLSLGLYSTYFLGPYGIVTGMIGLISSMFHGTPGYHISLNLGLIPFGVTVKGTSQLLVGIVNGAFWGLLYGAIGYGIDRFRNRTKVL